MRRSRLVSLRHGGAKIMAMACMCLQLAPTNCFESSSHQPMAVPLFRTESHTNIDKTAADTLHLCRVHKRGHVLMIMQHMRRGARYSMLQSPAVL